MQWPFSKQKEEEKSGCPYNHDNKQSDNPILSKEVSTIPKSSNNNDNWVYPSQLQFFEAMKRKGHNPNPRDMNTIVPIHNAVNERAWMEIKKWEDGKSDCEIYLHSFKGRPQDRSPKAWIKTALGFATLLNYYNLLTKTLVTHHLSIDTIGLSTDAVNASVMLQIFTQVLTKWV